MAAGDVGDAYASSGFTTVASGTDGIYIYGAQVELGLNPIQLHPYCWCYSNSCSGDIDCPSG